MMDGYFMWLNLPFKFVEVRKFRVEVRKLVHEVRRKRFEVRLSKFEVRSADFHTKKRNPQKVPFRSHLVLV